MLEELERELESGRFRSLYLVLGEEDYLARRAVALIRKKVLPDDSFSFNLGEFSVQDTPIREVLAFAETYPMMAPRRLAIVTDLNALSAADQEPLIRYLNRPNDKCIMVLRAADLDKRTTFYRTAKGKCFLVDCAKLKGKALLRWTQAHLSSKGLRISARGVEKLVDLAGSDLQTLANECEKLRLYAGPPGKIPDAALDDLVSFSRQHTIFELTDAVGRLDRPRALQLLGNLLDSGEPSLLVLAMMARHFRQLLIAREMLESGRNAREIGSAAQIPPFLLQEFLQQAKGLPGARAQRLFVRLSEADRRLKTTPSDPRMVLENLICSL